MQPGGPMEQDEWAHVIAGTADMRAEPSLQSQLIFTRSRRLAGAGHLA